MKKLITGVKPTGESMHIGNLLWAVLPFAKLAEWHDAAACVVNLHAVNTVKDGNLLRKQTLEIATEYLAVLWPDSPIKVFLESEITSLPILSFILSNVTQYSLMLRAHVFKDSEAKGIDINMGTFNYPILMAADILAYDIDIVPVWQDQMQHLEMARDIARAFNKTYKSDIFNIPKEYIGEWVGIIPGIDGRKMSKSYNNFIGVFDDEKTLKKRIGSIVTDSRGVDEPKDPEACNIFALIKLFALTDRVEIIRAKYLAGGYGYGHAKAELFEILFDSLRPYRERREALLRDPGFIESRLAEGARVMNARIEEKMAQVSAVVGL